MFALNQSCKGYLVNPFISTAADVNLLISSALRKDMPFSMGRMGRTESRLAGEYSFQRSQYSRLTYKQAKFNAGVFPANPKMLDYFARQYINAVSKLDFLGYWPSEYQIDLASRFYLASSSSKTIALHHDLEPFFHASPWTASLEGKQVLLVSSFGDVARYQHKKENLHRNQSLLPDFSLLCIDAPVCNANIVPQYHSWEEAFCNICKKVGGQSFDIALVSAGSFSIPLVAHIREKYGKTGIHIGACLQLLFGIQGGRWENQPGYDQLPTSAWIKLRDCPAYEYQSRVDQGDYI